MKYAVISDIHANQEALTAVLATAKELGCENYICLGDLSGYGASPNECIELVQQLPLAAVVMGNFDEIISSNSDLIGFGPQAAHTVLWTRENLTPENSRWLADLPLQQTVDGVLVVHGSPVRPERWGYILGPEEAGQAFSLVDFGICFVGHSHVPTLFESDDENLYAHTVQGGRVRLGRSKERQGIFPSVIAWGRSLLGQCKTPQDLTGYGRVRAGDGSRYIVNAGSVGQPRDGDPRASFMTYDDTSHEFSLRRVEYDIKGAQKKMLDAGLPERLAKRLDRGQ